MSTPQHVPFCSSLALGALIALPCAQQLEITQPIEPISLAPLPAQGDCIDAHNARSWPVDASALALPLAKNGLDQPDAALPTAWLGFAGGSHLPPQGERVDTALLERMSQAFDDGRAAAETYVFALLARRLTQADVDEWSAAGVRVLGTHPHNALKLALPTGSLGTLAAHPALRWVGYAKPWQKLQPRLLERSTQALPGERIEAFVSVFDSDECAATTREPEGTATEAGPGQPGSSRGSGPALRVESHGWQQRRLEALGLEVGEYLPRLRTFAVRLRADQLAALAGEDFVLFAESRERLRVGHDESTPLILSDYVRATFDGAWSGEAVAGVIDSGMYISHDALQHAYSVSFDHTGTGAWTDTCEHGTHVIGTVLADPPSPYQELRGNAPGLGFAPDRRFRSSKVFYTSALSACDWNGPALSTLFGDMRSDWSDGSGNVSPKPHLVSNSWGSGPISGGYIGSEADPRDVDAEVFDNDQTYLFCGGNDGPGANTIWSVASAKNAIAVGNVLPYPSVGAANDGSSRGPCGDGRWKPNLCAPGTSIMSCDSGTENGYSSKTGTSMATPHVAGVVAQLVDRYSFLRYQPERISSVLMASATPKDNQSLTNSSSTHLNTYGAGRVDAFRASYGDSQQLWSNWDFTQFGSGSFTGDFTISSGATRLVALLHWIEPACSAGASLAVNADWDMYLDIEPFAAGTNEGEYSATSSYNNTEIRYVENPPAGNWRWKIHPYSVGLFDFAKLSITIHVIYADTTPSTSLTLSSLDRYLQPGDTGLLTASVYNPDFVASGIYASVSSSATLMSATSTLEDGPVADHMDNTQGGAGICLGDVRHGDSRAANWGLRWTTEGVKSVTVTADGDNTTSDSLGFTFYVDGTAPGLPTGLGSSTHTLNTWSNEPDITYTWSAATDPISGVDGYGISLSSAAGLPAAVKDIESVTSYSETLAASTSARFLSLRTVDNSGNWNASYASVGPYKIDLTKPGDATNLAAPGHPTSTWSNDTTIDFTWTPAADTYSGIDGYGWALSTGGGGSPAATKDIEELSSTTISFPSSPLGYYMNLRSVDNAGNWADTYATAGPYFTDAIAPSGVSISANATVTSTAVALTLAASDTLSGLNGMRFRNDGGSYSAWESFATSKSWNLTNGGGSSATGTRTIEFQVRDAAGNITSASTTTYYYHPVAAFGLACSGSLGTPQQTVSTIVKIGAPVSFTVSNTAAALKQCYLGLSKTSWGVIPLPLDLGLVGSPGCPLNVSPDFRMYSGAGTSFGFGIPNDPVVVGLHTYSQWMCILDPGGKLVVSTRGADIEINGS